MSQKTLIDRPKLALVYQHRSPDEKHGRFGGGWQWAVGFEAGSRHKNGGRSVILNLLVCNLRIEWKPDARWRRIVTGAPRS